MKDRFKINNVVNSTEFPWHKTRTQWPNKRNLDDIKYIVIHQTLGNAPLFSVNAYHIKPTQGAFKNHISNSGCPHICYHMGIQQDGEIFKLNEFSDIVWHAKGANTYGLGIVLVGNFSGKNYVGDSEPSNEQLNSLTYLLAILLKQFSWLTVSSIKSHADFGKPACPGYIVQEFLNQFIINFSL